MRLAVLGDVHGNLGDAAQLLTGYIEATGNPLTAVLQVGDLMANRAGPDMEFSAAVENKYRYAGDFARYHGEDRRFPVPMLFCGGNHDSWNWLDEVKTGWLNDWLYFLGRATSTEHEGLNICCLSGIYHPKKSHAPDRQRMPVTHTAADRKSFTYCVEGEVDSLIELEKTDVPCDILLLHDWPTGLDRRPFVGNPLANKLIAAIKPRWVFCGHMHRYHEGTIAGSKVVCLNAVKAPEPIPREPALYVFDPADMESGRVWPEWR
ncbi:MAG: metallophosphoesterase [bacterium]